MLFKGRKAWLALLALVFVVAACSQGNAGETGAGSNDSPSASTGEEAASDKPKLPLVNSPLTLDFYTALDSKVSATMKSNNETAIFPYLEKETGIKINFVHPPSGMEQEQFNLMISSSDLPDLMSYNWSRYPGGPQKAINDGVIISLNDLVDKHAPFFKKYLNDHPDIKKDIITDDGTIYSFPLLREEKIHRFVAGFQLRKDWLDKYQLAAPQTIDDWYRVLTTFKEKDPSIIPFSGNSGHVREFMSAWGITFDFYVDGNQIKFGPAQPEYKAFLETIKKWYDEGLIDKDFATSKPADLDAKVTGSKTGSFNALLNGGMGRYLDLMKNDPQFQLVGVANPLHKDGVSYNFKTETRSAFPGGGVAVSGTTKKAVEAVKWLDIGYSPWGHLLFNFGLEGQSYTMVNGYPKLTDEITKNPKWSLVNALARYSIGNCCGRFFVEDARLAEQVTTYPAQLEAGAAWSKASSDRALPSITPTLEESKRLSLIMTEVKTYADEMFLKFIFGNEPLSNFDAYLARLKQMKIDEAVGIQQTALERYTKR